jgi:VWFA-related protein
MTHRRAALLFAVLLLSCCQCAPVAKAQSRRVQTRIVSDVELVRVPVIVFNNKGGVATALDKNDFRLFEDGVQQKILSYEMDRVPVSFVIVADVSSSMTSKIPFVQDAAASILDPPQKGSRPDEYSILSVASRSRLLVPFTTDEQDLGRRLPFLLTATKGKTALFDGIYLGLNVANEDAANDRQAMIIITDGGDNHSRYNLQQTKRMLEEADMPVFTVMAGAAFALPPFLTGDDENQLPGRNGAALGLPNLPFGRNSHDYIGPAERRGPHNMKILADVSGGAVFTARHGSDIPRIVRTIALAVRYRYILTYRPSRDDPFAKTAQTAAGGPNLHRINLELYPKQKFAGYSIPYYKHMYRSFH